MSVLSSWTAIFKSWSAEETPTLTNPDLAENEEIGDAIVRFQEAAKALTDELATLSSTYQAQNDKFNKGKDAITLAYVAALNGNLTEVVNILKKVV